MTERKLYTMSQEQFDAIIETIKPQPYMIIGGVAPRSQQERANDAWRRLGEELGFKYMTVKPNGRNQLEFTAEPKDEETSNGES